VEPIAAVTATQETLAQHQRLLHFVAEAPWSDKPVLAKVRELVVPAMERHGPIEAWIIDDTSFPKCGSKSVGVQLQYCACRVDFCGFAFTADHAASQFRGHCFAQLVQKQRYGVAQKQLSWASAP
jgi:SRSO17 transposase